MARVTYHEEETLRQLYDNLRHYGEIYKDDEYSNQHAYRITQFIFENEKYVVFMVDGTIKFISNLTQKKKFRNFLK